jgi:hypothetical protein
MKRMTCKQLSGACDLEFEADNFEAMADLSKKHGMEMYKAADQPNMAVMGEMQKNMQDPNAMKEWMDEKRKLFDSLPEVK